MPAKLSLVPEMYARIITGITSLKVSRINFGLNSACVKKFKNSKDVLSEIIPITKLFSFKRSEKSF